MYTFPTRVLVAEDYEPFQRFLVSTLRNRLEVEDIHTVSDGLKAVQAAQRLQPGLILLDIGLPGTNGIEAARQIRDLSPVSKIIFVTQESSAEMLQAALNAGAFGYLVKADVGIELLPAITLVLRGDRSVSRRFAGYDSKEAPLTADGVPPDVVPSSLSPDSE